MEVGFEKWWKEFGEDLGFEGVKLNDKGKALASIAFGAGTACGMARSKNYTANDSVMPDSVTFANGRVVRIVDNPNPNVLNGVFLQVD